MLVQNSSFVGNVAGGAGGGMLLLLSSLEMVGGVFINNSATSSAGLGVTCAGSPPLLPLATSGVTHKVVAVVSPAIRISSSYFLGNVAVTHGGGVSASNYADFRLIGCTFMSNGAKTQYGGAVTLDPLPNAVSNISGSLFVSNSAGSAGGAVLLGPQGSDIFYLNSFQEITAGDRGGAVCVFVNSILIQACSFFANAARHGGAVWGRGANGYSANANDDDSSFQWCSVVCVGSVFFSNTVQCGGGALDMGVSSLTIQDCLLVWNAAIAQASPVCESVGGGGVYFVGVSFTAARTTFTGCSAGINEPAAQAWGGAVLAYSDATASSAFQLVNCTMCGNSVFTQYSSGTAGGGAAVAWFQRVVINSCDFTDNFGNFGGVLFVYGGVVQSSWSGSTPRVRGIMHRSAVGAYSWGNESVWWLMGPTLSAMLPIQTVLQLL